MSDKHKKMIDRVLPAIPLYGPFQFFKVIEASPLSKETKTEMQDLHSDSENAPQYMVDNGFLVPRDDLYFPRAEYHYQLTDRGRKLKACGSLYQFDKDEKAEQANIESRNKRDLYTYRIQFWIMVGTIVAAIYYTIMIFKEIF